MRRTSVWAFLLGSILLVCALGWAVSAQRRRPAGAAWEYKVVYMWQDESGKSRQRPVGVSDLNEYGAQGWELVSVVADPGAGTCFYLKRAK